MYIYNNNIVLNPLYSDMAIAGFHLITFVKTIKEKGLFLFLKVIFFNTLPTRPSRARIIYVRGADFLFPPCITRLGY